MAYALNQATLLGNVGKDPEIAQFASGDIVATFNLATTHSYKPKDSEEWKEIVDWHTIKAFGSQAKTIASYVRKGHKIEVVGQIKNNNYTDDKDVKHYGYYIRVEKLILLEKISGKFADLPIKQVEGSQPAEAAEDPESDIPF